MRSFSNSGVYYSGHSILIRAVTSDDAALLYSWMQEDFFHNYRPYLTGICTSSADVSGRIEALASLNIFFEIEALILHRLSNKPIGVVSLSSIDQVNLKAEFSVAFRWGLGTRCTSEALWALFHYAFVTMEFNKLYCYVTSDNARTLRMLRRYDGVVTQEGFFREEVLSQSGKWLDLYRFCILRRGIINSPLFDRLSGIWESRR